MWTLITLLLTIALLCAIPAYLIGRKGIRDSLLAAEEGFSTRSCVIFYTVTGLIFGLLLLYLAYYSSALIFGCLEHPAPMQYVQTGCAICSTVLLSWLHIHTRRARQRRKHKHETTHRLSSLVSGLFTSAGLICLWSGLGEPALALLGVLIFAMRHMISYTAHKK